MMGNTSKDILIYHIILILTVTCNYTIAVLENDPGATKYDPVSDQNGDIEREIHIAETQTDEFRDSIQIGMRYAIQDIATNPQEVLYPSDYTEIVDIVFKNPLDTNLTPARYYKDFTFIIYGSKAFRHIRHLFDINQNDYIQSCSHSKLRKVSNPGASGSIFYFTEDDKFVMKSVQSTEFKVLEHLLPTYREHMEKYPGSLLTKLSGLYGYKRYPIEIKFISMKNFLPSKVKMHLKYDLKGSTFHRTAPASEKLKRLPTFRDLDFKEHFQDGLFLMPHTLSDLLKTINSDLNFLKSLNIMDYSLLVGVHKIDEDTSAISQAASARWKRLMVDSIGMESILADTRTFPDEDCPSLIGSIPAESESGERLLLFLGIIDILQEYRLSKKIENGLKTIAQLKNITIQSPDIYAPRLMHFLIKPISGPEVL